MFSFTRGQDVSGISYNGKVRVGKVEDIINGGKSIVLKSEGQDGKPVYRTLTIALITKAE